MKHVIGIVVSAVALGVAAWLVPGIIIGGYTISGYGHVAPTSVSKAVTLLAVAVIFGVINTILKPVIKTIGCGLYVLTLGLVAIVVNGLLLWLVRHIARDLKLAFHITRFVAPLPGA